MSVAPVKPTEAQKHWLAHVFGPHVWQELCRKPEFCEALDSSMGLARMIALRHLAARNSPQTSLATR